MSDIDTWPRLNEAIITCQACPRLVQWREQVSREKVRRHRDETYWGKPLPGFGDPGARLFILGLAPAAHGGNRTGRMFTGDDSGNWLYAALYRYGFANQPHSTHAGDGLELQGAFISNTCRCVPPDNKPTPGEVRSCRPFLLQELALLREVRVVLCLGKIAFDAYLQCRKEQGNGGGGARFGHGAEYAPAVPGEPWLLASYHPSRQNTNTGKLTRPMWHAVFARARSLVDG